MREKQDEARAELQRKYEAERRAMLEASPYVRTFLYHDFARRLKQLGYEIETPKSGEGFGIGFGTRCEPA